jgi:hypothetical protein
MRFTCLSVAKAKFIYVYLYLIFVELNIVWMKFELVMSHVR